MKVAPHRKAAPTGRGIPRLRKCMFLAHRPAAPARLVTALHSLQPQPLAPREAAGKDLVQMRGCGSAVQGQLSS